MFKRSLLTASILFIAILAQAQSRFEEDLDGVSWSKTLRVRGIITRFDPFNETSLYRISSESNQSGAITARKELVQFETIASGFWGVLRDSLEQAIRLGSVNVYTLGFPRTAGKTEIRVKRTKVTYDDLLDSLSFAFVNHTPPNDRLIQIFDPSEDGVTGMSRLVERAKSQARGRRVLSDLRLFSAYELELAISVDETGFKIKPTGLIFGSTHLSDEAAYDPKTLLSNMYTGYDTSDPRSPKNIGFYVDLSEDKTMRWLIENGMQYSGERNIIPFYDLITLFHYPYKIYAESNNVLAVGAFAFRGKYNLAELEKTLLDRYNDMMYMYLYGQAPEWWDQGKRGAFTNGMFEMDTVRKKAIDTAAGAKTEESPRGGRSSSAEEAGTQSEQKATPAAGRGTSRRGGGGTAATGTQAADTKPAPAQAKPKTEDKPKAASGGRRRRGGG